MEKRNFVKNAAMEHYLNLSYNFPSSCFAFLPSVRYLLQFLMMDSATPMPSNVHISQHPCVRAKLSRLRSKDTDARETKELVHEIATMLGCDALGRNLEVVESGMVSLFVQTGPD